MASGTPVLAAATGGLIELIQDGVSGWLVPPKSSASLARAIEKIAAMTSAELDPIKEKGLELVRTTYTWERIAAKTEEIYDAALKRWQAEMPTGRQSANGREDSGKARQQLVATKAQT
jgi:glycosyltransferase involved in cell wall biosynthesis